MYERISESKHAQILLKRAIGREIHKADVSTLAAFYDTVHSPVDFEEKAFYIACLYAKQGKNGTLKLPEAWRIFAKKAKWDNNRILRMLDAPWSRNTAVQLVRIAQLLIDKGYKIDLENLSWDVRDWGTPKMKRRWIITLTKTEKENNYE